MEETTMKNIITNVLYYIYTYILFHIRKDYKKYT